MIGERKLRWIAFLAVGLAVIGAACSKKPGQRPVTTGEIVGEIDVVPKPALIKRLGGAFPLDAATTIVADGEKERVAASLLNELLERDFQTRLAEAPEDRSGRQIVFKAAASETNPEEYRLSVEPNGIVITGASRGLIPAVLTLIQLIPNSRALPAAVPSVEITDQPRFPYRGMHLDVARHFMPAEFVKKYIDLMAAYKFNYFHWHLTDDQGWRIEIQKYPKLTTIGSFRPESVVGKQYSPYLGDKRPVSGFYTQEEVRDIVGYAARRQVMIIPEIDLPGHASAALASYPEIGCDPGRQYKVKTTWGGFPDIVCPSDDAFTFIEAVIDEVSALFPDSPYIHIGGDEVEYDQWRTSPIVRQIMQREGLSNEREVKSWFMRRVASIAAQRGKRVIGWDDALGDGLDTATTIMSWQGMKYAADAARAGHEVIVAPADFTYFDHPQGDPESEPLSLGKEVSLEKVYGFDPIPPNLTDAEAARVIGGQGCVWTEFIKFPKDVEYMAVPRLMALSEVLWSPPGPRNFSEFYRRLAGQFARLDKFAVAYRIPEPLGFTDRVTIDGKPIRLSLESPVRAGRIYFTTDGGDPHRGSNVYGEPFEVRLQPNQKIEIKARVIGPDGKQSRVFMARLFRPGEAPMPAGGR